MRNVPSRRRSRRVTASGRPRSSGPRAAAWRSSRSRRARSSWPATGWRGGRSMASGATLAAIDTREALGECPPAEAEHARAEVLTAVAAAQREAERRQNVAEGIESRVKDVSRALAAEVERPAAEQVLRAREAVEEAER